MNNNCLEGIKCPSCGSEGPFFIEAKIQVLMWDSGSECNIYTYHLWDGASYMRCYECDKDGPAQDFRIEVTTQ
jgi:hypothetical protein